MQAAESGRDGFKSWYRNPDRASQDSLGIAYEMGDGTRIMRPDFVFFSEQDGAVVADIVDPHGVFLADALPKLQGLATYATAHQETFRRIEAVAEAGGRLRVLDMTPAEVRSATMAATDAGELYASALAGDYI